jgi:intraflagellar transport protein 52
VYVNGATLNVNRSSTAVLSTGSVCFPINRPIAAFHTCKGGGGGKLAVVGSVMMFVDQVRAHIILAIIPVPIQYIDREDNGKVFDVILQFLTDDTFKLNAIDSDDPEIADYHSIPDHIMLCDQLKVG